MAQGNPNSKAAANAKRKAKLPSGRKDLVTFLRGKGFIVSERSAASDIAKAKEVFTRKGKSGAKAFRRFQKKQGGKSQGQIKTEQVEKTQNKSNPPATKDTGGGGGGGTGGGGGGGNKKQSKASKSGQQNINKPDLGLSDVDISQINSKKLAALLTRQQFGPQFRELDEQIETERRQGESNIDQIGDFFDEAQIIRKRAATRADQSTAEALTEQEQTASAQIEGAQSGQEAAIQRQVSAVQSQFSGAASLKGQDQESFFNRLQGDLAEGESKAKLTQQRVTGESLRGLREERRGLKAERADAKLANFQTAEQLKLGRLAAVQNLQIGAALAPGQVALQDEQLRQGKQQRNQVRAQAKQAKKQNRENQDLLAQQIRGAVLDNDIKEQQLNDHLEEKRNAGKPLTIDGLDLQSRSEIKAGITEGLIDANTGEPILNPNQTAASMLASMAALGFTDTDPATKNFLNNVLDSMFPKNKVKRNKVQAALVKQGYLAKGAARASQQQQARDKKAGQDLADNPQGTNS